MKSTATQRLIEEAYTQYQNGSEDMELNTWMNLDNNNISLGSIYSVVTPAVTY